MPIYEYTCIACGLRFELLAPARHADKARCPECGASKTERALSIFAARSEARLRADAGSPCARCGDPDGPCSL
jgi:putative FmdB family regulatory protein